jgi:hypothetical protein
MLPTGAENRWVELVIRALAESGILRPGPATAALARRQIGGYTGDVIGALFSSPERWLCCWQRSDEGYDDPLMVGKACLGRE